MNNDNILFRAEDEIKSTDFYSMGRRKFLRTLELMRFRVALLWREIHYEFAHT